MLDDGALTTEQQAVADLAVDERVIVIAGPGAGKTHTLIHRAGELVRRDDLGGSEILILSFTNEVVGELQRRLDKHTQSTYIRPVTIDSMAGRVVARGGEGDGPIGFDATVQAATEILDRTPERAGIGAVRHVIVDEVQDLVDVRLDFVEALLRRSGGGFTLLGDPAQGIYGFSDAGTEASQRTGVEELLAAFPDARQMYLTGQHRSQRTGASPALDLRGVLLEGSGETESTYLALRRRLRDCDRINVDALAMVLRRADGSTGVLCRNNGEVLLLSSRLAEKGVRHRVRQASRSRSAPRWPAAILAEFDGSALTKDTFLSLAADQPGEWRVVAWRALRRVAGDRRGSVDVALLREHLDRLGGIADSEGEPSLPVLSTVHRSKGLEYTTCIVLEPEPRDDQPGDAEEARILFVAMTRGRSATLCLERDAQPGRLARRGGRWCLVAWRGHGVLRVELGSGDVDPTLSESASLVAEQRYLAAAVQPGDPVELVRAGPRYEVMHLGRRIGVTAPSFAPFGEEGPRRIDDVRVDRVRAAAGDPAMTSRLGLGRGGFWLVPEIVGLGRTHWRGMADESPA